AEVAEPGRIERRAQHREPRRLIPPDIARSVVQGVIYRHRLILTFVGAPTLAPCSANGRGRPGKRSSVYDTSRDAPWRYLSPRPRDGVATHAGEQNDYRWAERCSRISPSSSSSSVPPSSGSTT